MQALQLLDLVALIARARLLIRGDTGAAHVASNYAVPSVLLFGPTQPHECGPAQRQRHQVLRHGTRRGDPQANVVDPALLDSAVDEVLAHTEQALASRTIEVR